MKKGQVWLLDNLVEHETISGEYTNQENTNQLNQLSWMIGEWRGESDEFVATCSAKWSEHKKFILRQFDIERSGKRAFRATQRIGWDAGAKQIRSWVFDSHGGIFEGNWIREGDSWIVKSSGVLPDGSGSFAVNFWLQEGDDRCVLKSSHMNVGGVEVEDSVIEFSRVSAPSDGG